MASFKNIVVCSDFSDHADKAFEVAAAMAEGGAALTVLHVVPDAYDYGQMALGLGTTRPLGTAAFDVAALEGKLKARYAAKVEVPVEVAIEYGSEAAKIVSFAKDKGADVLVMGGRGIGFIAGLLGGGSIVEKVVKNSPIPVLVVPG